MSLKDALAFADRLMSDDAYRKAAIDRMPSGVSYESGKQQELFVAIAAVAKENGCDITAQEVEAAIDIKTKELGKIKSLGWTRKLKIFIKCIFRYSCYTAILVIYQKNRTKHAFRKSFCCLVRRSI